jgi:ATP/maltotriose-dependent transcriptional regulator MalT
MPPAARANAQVVDATVPSTVRIHVERGDLDTAERAAAQALEVTESDDVQQALTYAVARLSVLRARGDLTAARREADTAYATGELGAPWTYASDALVAGIDLALDLGDLTDAERRLAELEALEGARLIPILQAQGNRLQARLAAADGGDAGPRFTAAAAHMRELGLPFHLAVTELEHAEWLASQSRMDEAQPLLDEARLVFEQLGARPWLERADQVGAAERVPA